MAARLEVRLWARCSVSSYPRGPPLTGPLQPIDAGPSTNSNAVFRTLARRYATVVPSRKQSHPGNVGFAKNASDLLTSEPPTNHTPAQETPSIAQRQAAERLRSILDALPPVDWAVAYGSGVIHQANASSGSTPMTDFLLSTSSPLGFHSANLKRNPSHYPLWARIAGAKTIARAQDNFGAGIWYVTMVNIRGIEAKYGVISTSRLVEDLKEWKTLYVAGRLHKPVLTLKSLPEMTTAQSANLKAALALSLLILPPRFTEYQLWEQIAGISYSGDPRMSVPGAENPQKVVNIVRGPGNLEGFRQLYAAALKEVGGTFWALAKSAPLDGLNWMGAGEGIMIQSSSDSHMGNLISLLPRRTQSNVNMYHLTGVSESSRSGITREVTENGEERVVKDQAFRDHLLGLIRKIIYRPALTQSIKGLITAGPTKSLYYSLAKFRKWLQSRNKQK